VKGVLASPLRDSVPPTSAFETCERLEWVDSLEKLENAPAAISCQAESRSPIRPVSRRRVNQKALGGAQCENASPPPRSKLNEASERLQSFEHLWKRSFSTGRTATVDDLTECGHNRSCAGRVQVLRVGVAWLGFH
jgi:hypothetical protein